MDREKFLHHYNITDEFATEWIEPEELANLNLGESDGDKSRYGLLRQLTSSTGTASSMMTADEADPLGSTNSIISVLRAREIDVDSDISKRNKYLISSTTFSPRVFLRDVHTEATYDNLINALDYLESSITERSEALRYLVESDYDRFVKSKSSLDSVLNQIQSAGFSFGQEWGVRNVKGLIDDANSKATVIMKPVIDNHEKEERLKDALSIIKKNKYLFNLPSLISKHIKNNDHDSLIRDYRRGKDVRFNEDMSESPEYAIDKKVVNRIWREVENIVNDYKRETWKTLSKAGVDQNYIQVISKLLELGVEDNPIIEWIDSQVKNFSETLTEEVERLRLRTNLMRMALAGTPPSTASLLVPLKVESFTDSNIPELCDRQEVVEMWLTIKRIFDSLALTAEKMCLFWEDCNGFLSGTRQSNLPTGYQGESNIHLTLSEDEKNEIRNSGKELVSSYAENLLEYFNLSVTTIHGTSQDGYFFLPPAANALSSVRYLSGILTALSSSLKVLSLSNISGETTDKLRNVISDIRERMVHAACFSWHEDCKNFGTLEDWSIASDDKTFTKISYYFRTYQLAVLTGLRNMVFFFSRDGKEGSKENILFPQPSSRLISHTLSEFVDSNTLILNSFMGLLAAAGDTSRMSYMEKGSKENPDDLSPKEKSTDSLVLLLLGIVSEASTSTLPYLFDFFETSFSIPTRNAASSVRKTMDQLDSTLFELYTRKKRSALSDVIRHGFTSSGKNWTTNTEPTCKNKLLFFISSNFFC